MIGERTILEALFEPAQVAPCGFRQVRSYVRQARSQAWRDTHERLERELGSLPASPSAPTERVGEGVG